MIAITLLAIYIVSSNFTLWGGYRSFLVQSGSMEPSIMTGDIIVIQNRIGSSINKYSINDVVTFTNSDNRIVTHRIVEIKNGDETQYLTKGDANRSEDEATIIDSQIIGKVVLVIPKLGFLVAYTKTLWGLIILVLIPATIYILDELFKIKNVKSRS